MQKHVINPVMTNLYVHPVRDSTAQATLRQLSWAKKIRDSRMMRP
jgi:hypothetical protein